MVGADSLFHQRASAPIAMAGSRWTSWPLAPHGDVRKGTRRGSRAASLRAGQQLVEFDLPGGSDIVGRLLLPDGAPAVQWNVVAQKRRLRVAQQHRGHRRGGSLYLCEPPASHYRLVATGAHTFSHTGGRQRGITGCPPPRFGDRRESRVSGRAVARRCSWRQKGGRRSRPATTVMGRSRSGRRSGALPPLACAQDDDVLCWLRKSSSAVVRFSTSVRAVALGHLWRFDRAWQGGCGRLRASRAAARSGHE